MLKNLSDFLNTVGNDWNYILPTELRADIDQGKDYFILDTRKPEDFFKGHIQNAVNIFWLNLLRPENIDRLPRDKRIIICCYVGHTASQVLVMLRLLGYDARVLKFGMGKSPAAGVPVAGWENYGFDLVC